MSFATAVGRVIKAEGSEYENVPGDAGGATKFGITHEDLGRYLGKKDATNEEVKNMTRETAEAIYKKLYWDSMGCDLIRSEKIQQVLFDQGVNRGSVTAARQFQLVLQNLGAKIGVDGNIGTVTSSATNGFNENDVCREYLQAATHSYVDIVKRNPSQIKFLSGWINRLQNLEDLCWTGNLLIPTVPVTKPEVAPEVVLKGGTPYDYAVKEIGQKEIVGPRHNPRIIEYHAATSGKFSTDEVPWCASFINWVGRMAGMEVTNSALASSWDKYNVGGTDSGEVGDIVTLRHPSGGRHVALLNKPYKKGDHTFEALGGNQNNQVKLSTYNSSEIVSIRKWKPKKGVAVRSWKRSRPPVELEKWTLSQRSEFNSGWKKAARLMKAVRKSGLTFDEVAVFIEKIIEAKKNMMEAGKTDPLQIAFDLGSFEHGPTDSAAMGSSEGRYPEIDRELGVRAPLGDGNGEEPNLNRGASNDLQPGWTHSENDHLLPTDSDS
jgi:uncharacterized protein (TIGR02594 family)